VLGFNETHPCSIFKKLCQTCKNVTGLKNTDDYCCQKVMSIINHFVVYFKDKSTEDTERKLNLYVLTNDGEQNTFDLWNTLPKGKGESNFYEKFCMENRDDKFENALGVMMERDVKANFVVELMASKSGKAFLKIYDTIFLPQDY